MAQNRIGLSYGQWQPNSLETEEPASVFSGTADSTPYLALHADWHVFAEISLHTSAGYWSHLFRKRGGPETITILPFEVGLEHELVAHSPITPYAIYGAGLLLASFHSGNFTKLPRKFARPTAGFDIFLVTGIRFMPLAPLGGELNFGYVVAVLPKKLGVGDYSGLRATVGIFVEF